MTNKPTRTILHLDLDAFFCAVEEQRDPSLRGKPFAVGGRPDQRGVVASCSYPARKYGVRSALPMATAVRLCPDLIIVDRHFGDYSAASKQVMERLNALTPLVEQLSIDEAFLDVTGLPGDGESTARALQRQINGELGLPCSLGVATNKLVAKVANNIGKSAARGDLPPNAIKVIPPGGEAAFLAPLPVRELWGVGPKTAERLAQLGIETIGDIADHTADELQRLFGKHGADIARRARGSDDRPVETDRETKSVSKETTFAHDVADFETLTRSLRQLSEGVGRRLRRDDLRGTTVKIKLRWSDFTTLTRQLTLPQPIDQDDEIYLAALDLFGKTWTTGRPVRLIGVGVSGFEMVERQLSLWEANQNEQDRRLQDTLDRLRGQFGDRVIQRGSDLKPDDV